MGYDWPVQEQYYSVYLMFGWELFNLRLQFNPVDCNFRGIKSATIMFKFSHILPMSMHNYMHSRIFHEWYPLQDFPWTLLSPWHVPVLLAARMKIASKIH